MTSSKVVCVINMTFVELDNGANLLGHLAVVVAEKRPPSVCSGGLSGMAADS